MGKTDIRLSVGFRHHPKTRKLERALGPQGVLSLIWLFMFLAENRPDGKMYGMDNEDIALAAGWEGGPEVFIDALLAVRFLDQNGKGMHVHDWLHHQPWVSHAKERSERAKQAAKARWEPKEKQQVICGEHAASMRDAQSSNAKNKKSNAPLPSPLPLPSPSPIPEEKNPPTPQGGDVVKPAGAKETKTKRESKSGPFPDAFIKFWSIYPRKDGKAMAAKAWAKIAPDEQLAATIMKALGVHTTRISWRKDSGQFIPHASTWLNQRRWEDEVHDKDPDAYTPEEAERERNLDMIEAARNEQRRRDAWERARLRREAGEESIGLVLFGEKVAS